MGGRPEEGADLPESNGERDAVVRKFMLRERFLAQGTDVAIRAEGPDIPAAAPPTL